MQTILKRKLSDVEDSSVSKPVQSQDIAWSQTQEVSKLQFEHEKSKGAQPRLDLHAEVRVPILSMLLEQEKVVVLVADDDTLPIEKITALIG